MWSYPTTPFHHSQWPCRAVNFLKATTWRAKSKSRTTHSQYAYVISVVAARMRRMKPNLATTLTSPAHYDP